MSSKNSAFILSFIIILAIAAAVFDYEPFWQKISGALPWSLGLDLAGGSLLIYEIDLNQVAAVDQSSVVRGLRDVIEKRVNLFGVSEPRVYTEKSGDRNRLVVELAGVRDISAAIKEIGETPFLDFREVIQSGTSAPPEFIATDLNGRYIKSAQLAFDQVSRQPYVQLLFNEEGARIFERLTERNIGKPLAIFLDNELIEIPVVQEKISGGQAQISGRFTIQSAKTLVERFNAGALPAPIVLVNQQTINADFGRDSLEKAILAGVIGTIAVMIFMILYYRMLGLYAVLALFIYIVLTLALFKLIPITLTLSGIAGLILSVGMAVDANILVFERTKEEVKRGFQFQLAIEEGFRRAWTSIRDSNVSTLITAVVLYYFTSSFVRGFALALFIGVVMSMFSAITVTRTLLRVFWHSKAFSLSKNRNY